MSIVEEPTWNDSRIIHQTWRDDMIPERWETSKTEWSTFASTNKYEYKFWTDDDNLAFLTAEYPDYVEFYESLVLGVQKSHFMRYVYMKHFGGIFVDLDVIPTGNKMYHLTNTIAEPFDLVLSREVHFDGNEYVSTGFIMSKKDHPFWDTVLSRIREEDPSQWSKLLTSTFRHYEVIMKTGSRFLTKTFDEESATLENVLVLPTEWIRPAEDQSSTFVKLVKGGPTWRDWDSQLAEYTEMGWDKREWVLVGILLLMLFVIILMAIF